MKKYEIHDIANTLPMMSKAEHNALVSSMENKGYDTDSPIILFEGKILDGRNRYKAALEIGCTPTSKEFKGTNEEAEQESLRLNINRRNMNKGQMSMIAAKEVQRTREAENEKKLSVAKAGMLYGVSAKYINRALKILKEDTQVAENVFNGLKTISSAEYDIETIKNARIAQDYDIDSSTESDNNEEHTRDDNTDTPMETTQGHEQSQLETEYEKIMLELQYYKEHCTCGIKYKNGE